MAKEGLKRPYTEALKEFERLVASSYDAALSLPNYEQVRVALGVHEAGMQYILTQWKQKVEPELLGQKPLAGQRRRERRHRASWSYILDSLSKGKSPSKLAKEYREYKRTALYNFKEKIDSREIVKRRDKWVYKETGEPVEQPKRRRRR